ncbi:OmpA family protein [Reichenbachiella versicolor]|uniref:OmpA family protein n=1 Tax=Reichenbachiella versicolor TaxID=1821036 RepID=UPI0013A57C13|nr:OmpA family protein [Reichenbachiella versicolor]
MNRIAILFFLLTSQLSFFQSIGQVQVYSDQIPADSIINSIYNEGNVVLSPDDSYLYFTRANHPENLGGINDDGDIWMAEIGLNGNWGEPKNVKSLNDIGLNQVIGFVDPRTLLARKGNSLVSYYYFNGRWFEPKTVDIPYFKPKSSHITGSVSHDGNFLVIAMESFGSHGVEDIYYSQKKSDGSWTPVKNLGEGINSKFQEITPFLASDNKTLFFSSNGYGGEGSFDVFVSQRLDDTWRKWSEPVNLGNKINTPGRESSFNFSSEQAEAYLVSTQNSEGYGDIKRVKIKPDIGSPDPVVKPKGTEKIPELKEMTVELKGKVTNKKTNKPEVNVEVIVYNLDSTYVYSDITNEQGDYRMKVASGLNYSIHGRKKLFFSIDDDFYIGLQPISEYSFEMTPVEEGTKMALEHVLFEQGKAVLIKESMDELNLIVEMMKQNPEVNIFLGGHTDNQGKASSNLKLSKDRVATVTHYLVSQGVSTDRISGKGYGGTRPRASNASLETRKLNRRVEVTIHLKNN